MPSIYLIHDPLSPAHAIRDGSYRCRNTRSAIVLCKSAGRQNRGGDQQHTLATFVHSGSLALSPYIRHGVAGVRMPVLAEERLRCRSRNQSVLYVVTKVENKGRNLSAEPNLVRAGACWWIEACVLLKAGNGQEYGGRATRLWLNSGCPTKKSLDKTALSKSHAKQLKLKKTQC